MRKQFSISKVCSQRHRPEYSYLVDEYLEKFIDTNILMPFKIINGTRWNIVLSMLMLPDGPRGPKGVFVFNKPRTLSQEMLKIFPVQIPYEEVFKNDTIVKNVVCLYFEAFKQFFTRNYKKIPPEYFNQIEQKIDWKYILSLPYPVEIRDQRYVGDISELNLRQV